MLIDHRSLSGQAEDLDTDEAYRELIDKIREMSSDDIFDKLYEAENVLKILVRKEANDSLGIKETVIIIKNLCMEYLGEDVTNDIEIP